MNNKIAFLTETNFSGKWDVNFPNARTEIAWQIALDSYHYNIWEYLNVRGYDHVFVIIPKGEVYLNSVGAEIVTRQNSISELLRSDFTEILKNNNKRVYFIQEGSTDEQFNDYSVEDQFHYYNHLVNFDIIFAHNEYDTLYYKGMFPSSKVEVIRSLMIENTIKHLTWNPKDHIIIGGNFSNFYRGFQSYIAASNIIDHEKWIMTSHSTRYGETDIHDLNHIPRISWKEWMERVSTFKCGIHLMNLRAAGTFQLNCAYFGIPVVGNKLVDTQHYLCPEFSVDVYDMKAVNEKCIELNDIVHNKNVLTSLAESIRDNYKTHYSLDVWKNLMYNIIL